MSIHVKREDFEQRIQNSLLELMMSGDIPSHAFDEVMSRVYTNLKDFQDTMLQAIAERVKEFDEKDIMDWEKFVGLGLRYAHDIIKGTPYQTAQELQIGDIKPINGPDQRDFKAEFTYEDWKKWSAEQPPAPFD